MSWQAFCRQRQLEMARTDWFSGLFGFVLRAVSFVKSSRQHHSVSTKVEHAVYSVLALVILISSLRRSLLYARLRVLCAVAVRTGVFLGQVYVFQYPLLHKPILEQLAPPEGAAAAAASGARSWDSNDFTFLLKVVLACKAFFFAFAAVTLPLPPHWMLLVQPLSLFAAARNNAGLCSTPAMEHPRAVEWMRRAACLLRVATAAGAPGVDVREGCECQAVLLYLQVVSCIIFPFWFCVRWECRRFAEFAAEKGLVCNRAYARLYLKLHAWANGREFQEARLAVLAALLCGSWIVITVAYTENGVPGR